MDSEENLIKFNCPFCGQRLEAPADMQGEAIKCPVENCQETIQIPLVPKAEVKSLLPPPPPPTTRTIKPGANNKSISETVRSTYLSGRLTDVLGILEKYPWNFEAIDFLIDRDPCSIAKLAPTVIACRATDSSPTFSEQMPEWRSLAHPQDNTMLAELSRAPTIAQAVAQQQALWMDASYKREMLLNTVA